MGGKGKGKWKGNESESGACRGGVGVPGSSFVTLMLQPKRTLCITSIPIRVSTRIAPGGTSCSTGDPSCACIFARSNSCDSRCS